MSNTINILKIQVSFNIRRNVSDSYYKPYGKRKITFSVGLNIWVCRKIDERTFLSWLLVCQHWCLEGSYLTSWWTKVTLVSFPQTLITTQAIGNLFIWFSESWNNTRNNFIHAKQNQLGIEVKCLQVIWPQCHWNLDGYMHFANALSPSLWGPCFLVFILSVYFKCSTESQVWLYRDVRIFLGFKMFHW